MSVGNNLLVDIVTVYQEWSSYVYQITQPEHRCQQVTEHNDNLTIKWRNTAMSSFLMHGRQVTHHGRANSTRRSRWSNNLIAIPVKILVPIIMITIIIIIIITTLCYRRCTKSVVMSADMRYTSTLALNWYRLRDPNGNTVIHQNYDTENTII